MQVPLLSAERLVLIDGKGPFLSEIDKSDSPLRKGEEHNHGQNPFN